MHLETEKLERRLDQRLRAKHAVVSNWQAKKFQEATTRYHCRTRQERNFGGQRPEDEIGSFAAIEEAETALTRKFGRHVFEIARLLRVYHNTYNDRVCLVETEGTELAAPHAVLSNGVSGFRFDRYDLAFERSGSALKIDKVVQGGC